MKSKRLKAKFKKSADNFKHCTHFVLTLSIDARMHTGEGLRALVQPIQDLPLKNGIILICDDIERIIHRAIMDESNTCIQTVFDSLEWENANLEFLQQAFPGHNVDILFWKNLHNKEHTIGQYISIFGAMIMMHDRFTQAIDGDTATHFTRKLGNVALATPDVIKTTGANYYMERLAGLTACFTRFPSDAQIVHFFAGKELESEMILRSGIVSDDRFKLVPSIWQRTQFAGISVYEV